jgi:hypothetical protein
MFPLMAHRRQLVCGDRSDHSRFLGSFCLRFRVEGVEDGGTNENGEKEGDNIHTDAEKEGLPAANCVKGCAIHWILD